MLNLNIKQEKYKMFRQNTIWYGTLALVLLILYSAITNPHPSKFVIATGFGTGQWVTIIMIAIGSTFMSMEYSNNTMNTLIYKSRNKLDVYFSKLVLVLIYGVTLIVVGSIVAIGLKLLLAGSDYQWSSTFFTHNLFEALLLNDLGAIIYLLFISTLSFLLISWIKVNAAVIGVGLVIGFMGAAFSNLIVDTVPSIRFITAWNPLNMINVMSQLSNPELERLSNLSDSQLVIGNIVYALIFSVIGYLLFKRRHD